MTKGGKLRVLLASIVPPHNDGGGRILMYRHLVERSPFELHVASNADFADNLLIHTKLKLPWPVEKVRKSRFGPRFKRQILDFQNFVWPHFGHKSLRAVVKRFKPDLVFTVSDTSVCEIARKTADEFDLPLVGFFMDWVPLMEGHFGLKATQKILSERFKRFYSRCDLAFCISEGMRQALGSHSNAKILYPIPLEKKSLGYSRAKENAVFRLVYVGSALGFYGRMLQHLALEIEKSQNVQIQIIGPNSDWPIDLKKRMELKGILFGAKKPEEAEQFLLDADALLVVMSFEKDFELFMKTSFNTKISDYAAFGKPLVFWGPAYCAPSILLRNENAAMLINTEKPRDVIDAVEKLDCDPRECNRLAAASSRLNQTIFNPERLQKIFVSEMEKVVEKSKKICVKN
jgi:glycosyltransferase involved in cell wall biosynthesis